jgi:hypothetical protein
MLEFSIVYPIESIIYGDSFKEAVKNFIKLNRDMNITQMVIKDQSKNMQAQINYYQQDGRNKVGINMFPVGLNYPIPIVTNDTYVPPKVVNPIVETVLPLSPILSPVGPFIPSVIKIPNL